MTKRADRWNAGESVPAVLRGAAALSWRFLIILFAVAVIAYIVGYLAEITIPVAIALLLSALFAPAVDQLVRWKLPRALATAITVVLGLGVVGGVVTLFVSTFTTGLPQLRKQVSASINQIGRWLHDGPLHLTQDQLQNFLNTIEKTIGDNKSIITTGALNTASAVLGLLTGLLLCLFTLIFFLHDGGNIWRFLLKVIPEHNRNRVDVAGRRGFASLVSYVRATVAVALVDAVGIGLGLLIVGVPLVVPLAALVFLGAFVPIIGALVAGIAAILVALVTNGFVAAVIVTLIVIAVMQLESHILQPLLLGKAVKLHPLAVVLGVATGLIVASIPGALLAVPLLAAGNSAIRSLVRDPHSIDPDDVDAAQGKDAAPAADPEKETRPGATQ